MHKYMYEICIYVSAVGDKMNMGSQQRRMPIVGDKSPYICISYMNIYTYIYIYTAIILYEYMNKAKIYTYICAHAYFPQPGSRKPRARAEAGASRGLAQARLSFLSQGSRNPRGRAARAQPRKHRARCCRRVTCHRENAK